MSESSFIFPGIFNGLPGVAAVFSTRHGGTSQAPFDSLNTGFATGDDVNIVFENRARVLGAIGFDVQDLAWAEQVHGNTVREVSAPGKYTDCDALVTDRPRIALGIGVADCAALLLADVESGVAAAAHSGWRGTDGNISGRTVAEMIRLGAKPERIRVYASPCISQRNFEVGAEVAERFPAGYVRVARLPGKFLVDLKAVIRDQLMEAGIRPENVEISPACTFEQTETFYSYRAEAGRTGRMLGVIGLTGK